jgi:hypothetical protein
MDKEDVTRTRVQSAHLQLVAFDFKKIYDVIRRSMIDQEHQQSIVYVLHKRVNKVVWDLIFLLSMAYHHDTATVRVIV